MGNTHLSRAIITEMGDKYYESIVKYDPRVIINEMSIYKQYGQRGQIINHY